MHEVLSLWLWAYGLYEVHVPATPSLLAARHMLIYENARLPIEKY